MENWSEHVAIVGINEHETRKAAGVHPYALQAECILDALDDAGLTLGDVDGLAISSADVTEGGGLMPVIDLAEWLGIVPRFVDSTDIGGAGPIAQISHAAAAIAAGKAEVVVVSYAATPRSMRAAPVNTGDAVSGPDQYEAPYGFTVPAAYAVAASRHMALYGTTPEQLAQVAVTCRAHAADNTAARFRDPITIDDVLSSPTIAEPLNLLDCCVVTDGAGAVVLTSAARAASCAKPPVMVLGAGEAVSASHVSQLPDLTTTPAVVSGREAFAQAGVGTGDVDVAQLYDSFTINVLLLLEDLGFCDRGEGGRFVEDQGIGIDGALPVNTDGGGLSSNHPGRRGVFTVIESVRQLRCDGPGVQVEDPKIALASASGGWLSASATLVMGV